MRDLTIRPRCFSNFGASDWAPGLTPPSARMRAATNGEPRSISSERRWTDRTSVCLADASATNTSTNEALRQHCAGGSCGSASTAAQHDRPRVTVGGHRRRVVVGMFCGGERIPAAVRLRLLQVVALGAARHHLFHATESAFEGSHPSKQFAELMRAITTVKNSDGVGLDPRSRCEVTHTSYTTASCILGRGGS
jgi:hypothetical protein